MNNINNLISDLKQKNFKNKTVIKYLEKIPREIFVEKNSLIFVMTIYLYR